MRDGFSEKIRLFLINGIPLMSSLILMFLFFMPLSSVQINYFRPLVGLICVYYWTLKRKDLFGYISAFIIGFLTDVYSSSPLGINILLMMTVIAVTVWLSHYFQNSPFGAGWFIFALICLSCTILKWLFLMIYVGKFLPLQEALLNCFSTTMFYPLIVLINTKIQNRFLPQEYMNE